MSVPAHALGNGGGRRARAGLVLALAVCGLACAHDDEHWQAELESADVFERGLAAIALCEQSPEHGMLATTALLEALQGTKDVLREPARRALTRIGASAADDLLGRLRTETDLAKPVRKALIGALSAGGATVVPKLLAAMRDPGVSNVREIGTILARVGEPAIAPVVEELGRESLDKHRVPLVWVLGQIGPVAEPALPEILREIERGSPAFDAFALESLQQIQPQAAEILPRLHEGLASESTLVREAAARAIARTHVARGAERDESEWPAEISQALAVGEPGWKALVECVRDEREERSERDAPPEVERRRAEFARACLLAIGARVELFPYRRGSDPRAGSASSEPTRGQLFPDLVNDLPGVRGSGALQLATYGRSALAALPALCDNVADPHPGVVVASRWAVWCIVLDACAPHLDFGPTRRAEAR